MVWKLAPGAAPSIAASSITSSLGRGDSSGGRSSACIAPRWVPAPAPAPAPEPAPSPASSPAPVAAAVSPPSSAPTRRMAVRQSLTKEASGRASGRKSASACGVRRMAPSAPPLSLFKPELSSASAASSLLIVATRDCGATDDPGGGSHSYSYSMMYSGSTRAGSSATHARCFASSVRARHTLCRSAASASTSTLSSSPSSSACVADAAGKPVLSSSIWQLPRNTLAIITTPDATSGECSPRAEYLSSHGSMPACESTPTPTWHTDSPARVRRHGHATNKHTHRILGPPILAWRRAPDRLGCRARSSSDSSRVPDFSRSTPALASHRAGVCSRPTTGM